MKITNFEATGVEQVERFLQKQKELDETTLREILKSCNFSFVLEGINRLQSMLWCELKDSYVQQSQRYVAVDQEGYTLPALKPTDQNQAEKLISQALTLYQQMTVLKEDFKGRPKPEHYQYGIAIEDGRYLLPLAIKTNVTTAMSGDKLVDALRLFQDKQYGNLFAEIKVALLSLLPPSLRNILETLVFDYADNALCDAFYQEILTPLTTQKPVQLLGHFQDLTLKAGLGALTSTTNKGPQAILNDWGEEATLKAAAVANRVMSYGHYSISEQGRTTFGLRFSLVTYHQQERHRLPVNYRENLYQIIAEDRAPIVPESIIQSPFYSSFMALVNDFKKFRKYLLQTYPGSEALYFLLNCDPIQLVTSTNARIDNDILKERICFNAQWEIRRIAQQKLLLLRTLAPDLYQNALPGCVYGKCPEGRYTCGRSQEMRQLYQIENKGSEPNG